MRKKLAIRTVIPQGDDRVKIRDLSGQVVTPAADDNPFSRTTVKGFTAEQERLHRRYRQLERDTAVTLRLLQTHLRRRTRTMVVAFVTLEAKAGYCMVVSAPDNTEWWANLGQAVGLAVVAGCLVAPNIRRLLRLSSETALVRDGKETAIRRK